MPGSSQFGKLYSALVLRKLFQAGVLGAVVDVGAGCGTYRTLFADVTQPVHWTAIEVWPPYIHQFGLDRLYDRVVNQDVRQFDFAQCGADLVIFGDIIEHMDKEQAVQVVTRAVDACPYVMLSVPVVPYPQGAINDNPYEAHVKDDWSHDEMVQSMPNLVTAMIHDHIGVYFASNRLGAVQNLKQLHPLVTHMLQAKYPDERIILC